MMISKTAGAQLRGPGVRFASEGRGERQELDKRTKVKNRVIIMSVHFAYYCQ